MPVFLKSHAYHLRFLCVSIVSFFPVLSCGRRRDVHVIARITHRLCIGPTGGVKMSGRLIILPKKSWHPGKRENIERVLRDERLAAEEAAAARERAREIAQEGIVETLTKKRSGYLYPQRRAIGRLC